MTISLVIDTDVALGARHEGRPRDIDDGFAIVEALNAADLDLEGITTVFGNAPLDDTDRIARELIGRKRVDIPVHRGAAEALPQRGALPPPNAAVRFLAETLEARPVVIAAIGPLTNIGLLAHHYPDLLARAAQVVIVAGRSAGRRFYLGEHGPVRDFNFENDVRAMQLLRDAHVPLVLAGFELTSQVTVTEADLETIAARGTPAARYLHENSLAWVRHWTRNFPRDSGFHPWDSAAISWLRHPEYFSAERRGTRIVAATLNERELKRNPDGSPELVFWLECDASFPGPQVTYLTGFMSGGKAAFVRDIVDNVY